MYKPLGLALALALGMGLGSVIEKLRFGWIFVTIKGNVLGISPLAREHFELPMRKGLLMEIFGLSEGTIRLGVFATIFVTMACAEAAFPRKARTQPRSSRWLANWSLVIIDTLALRIVFPILAVGLATYAQGRGWGLLNLTVLPAWIEVIIAIILLDMAVWAQHVASHKIPMLWRVHKVHHADRDIDVTTGVRFHPIEILLSMGFKMLVVLALGPAALAVFLFEVILNASAMFNHANVKLPLGVDRMLRALIVTPDMHRVHHSIVHRETDSNYGFFLSVWDRIFGVYTAQPSRGHSGMVIGLDEHQDDKPSSALWSMMLPFRGVLHPSNQPASEEQGS